MQLVDYIDYRSIFEKVKTNHLKEFPTKESYIEYLKQEEEDYSFVNELYFALGLDFSEFDTDSSDTIDDLSLSNWLSENYIWLEFSQGGNDSNEGGDNYWGYGYQFKICLDQDIFIDFSYENYS